MNEVGGGGTEYGQRTRGALGGRLAADASVWKPSTGSECTPCTTTHG